MAFLIKNTNSNVTPQTAVVDQWQLTSVPTATNPASTSRALFNVVGGRVLVKALWATITTVQQTQTNNTSVTFTPTGGSNADVASNLDTTADAVGTNWIVEGDATALISPTTVNFFSVPAITSQFFVIDTGTIYWKTSATSTGAAKWDIVWQPLDAGGKVTAA